MADAFRTIIIPLSGKVNSRNIAAAFDKVGPEMFPTELSATGNNPATHVISSGLIPDTFVNLLPLKEWTWDGTQWTSVTLSSGDAAAIRAIANAKGYNFTLTQISNLLATFDVSTQEPFVAMARLGLKIINPPI